MASFRWVLLTLGLVLLALMFAYGRGWIPRKLKLPELRRAKADSEQESQPLPDMAEQAEDAPGPSLAEIESAPTEPPKPHLAEDSKVVTVRIMPQEGCFFPAEQLILALRAAGLTHGRLGIFHCIDAQDESRVRYSVASLIEPGSFDLSNLKDSEYPGISIFMVLPAPENGVELFDHMVETARSIARDVDGRLVDEQGGALSLQRERYMREEVIAFIHEQRQNKYLGEQQDLRLTKIGARPRPVES